MAGRTFRSHDEYTDAVAALIRKHPDWVAREGAETVAKQTLVNLTVYDKESNRNGFTLYTSTTWTDDGIRWDPYAVVVHAHHVPSAHPDWEDLGVHDLAVRMMSHDIRGIWDVICDDEDFGYDGEETP